MVKIFRCENGYILESFDSKTEEFVEAHCFQDNEMKDDDPQAAFRALVNHLIDYFDVRGSRYEKARLMIGYTKGDKHEQV